MASLADPIERSGPGKIWLTICLRVSSRLPPTAGYHAASIRSLRQKENLQMSLENQRAINAAPTYRKNDDITVLFSRATAYHQFGQLDQAKIGYKKILKKRPNHVDALRRLGICEHQTNDSSSAERLLRRALLADPRSAEARCDLGIVLGALQRPDEALACFDDLIAMKPDFAEAHFHRGNLLLGLRRFTEALASFDEAIAIDPRHLNALNNRGNALHELGRFADAIACYDRVLTFQPACAPAIVNRGAAFKDLRQAEKAIAEFDLALAIDPNHIAAWVNRGETLLVLRRLDEALASFDGALSINPQIALAWLGRANILMLTGKLADSAAACERALAIEPNSPKALIQLGQYHALKSDAEAAIACFDRALALKPDEGAALSLRIFTMDFSVDGTFATHQAARSDWWRNVGSKISGNRLPQRENDRDPSRRIVLGYVSADFRQHSAAYTFRPVLMNHVKTNFEVICYSGSPTEDPVTASFRQLADRWRNVLQWSDDQLVDCIQADKVDILIDLSGHTEGNRLHVFARKPAPIQVTAWGHATGTGLSTIDYLFSDPVSVPPEVRDLFAEQIYDLPCAITIEPPPAGLRSSEPPVIANGFLTYGVFNRVSKFSNAAISVWARILQSDLTSRLLIKDHTLDNASVQTMLLEKFASHGIAPDRICLMGSTSREEHLATYRRVDICLDPFPQGGGVSSWEALHMGVPVVAKLGNAFPKRLAGAILSAIELSDWVAADDDQYVEIALRSTADRLRTIRHELPDLIDRRCGPTAYTGAVEQAYRTMWEKHCGRAG
jgi:predicted O-linked N-acetylglucosamine transferase (SPINDLY family)